MKKLVLALISTFCLSSSFAYQLKVNTASLAETDEIDMKLHTVSGDCQIIDGKYNCQTTKDDITGLAVKYFRDYIAVFENEPNTKIVEVSFGINGTKLLNCQHLEKQFGQNVFINLTKAGCARA